MAKKWIIAAVLFTIFISKSNIYAQDTLKIDIPKADSIFLAKSYYLLAASLNIEAEKAMIIQAQLYPNPVFTADLNFIDPENKKVFHWGKTGQAGLQIEQLIILGGKRKSEIEMAKTNVAIAELAFKQLVIELKYQLHTQLFNISQQEILIQKYNRQMTLLDSLLIAYQEQAAKGNIALKEVVRLKSAYLQLNNSRAEILKEYFETQSILQKILQTSSFISIEFSESEVEKYIRMISLEELKIIAAENRPDLLILQQNNLLSAQYLQYQKQLAIPDINLFSAYDQRSGAFNHQVNIGFSIPLPFKNRNQGNIKAAQINAQQSQLSLETLKNEINSDIQNGYYNFIQTLSEYQKASSLYDNDFDFTNKSMTENFQKRYLSIVEFIDFFESYNSALTELARIKTQMVNAAEQLNLLTGKDIFK